MQYSARAHAASCHGVAASAVSLQVLAEDGIALRGLFVIDKEGIVQHSTINNLGFGRSVDETKRVLQAIQYIQSNPDEVCPAGWK